DCEVRSDEDKPIPPSDVEMQEDELGCAVDDYRCVSCNGEDLEGTSSGSGVIGTEYGKDEIAKIAVEGIGTMPAVKFDGSDEELEDLAAFIASLNEEDEESEE